VRKNYKKGIVRRLMQAIKELNLVKAGKLTARDARELIKEFPKR